MSGGVALNCTAVSNLSKRLNIDVFVPPAPTDAGSSIGAALNHQYQSYKRLNHIYDHIYTGTSIDTSKISVQADKAGLSQKEGNIAYEKLVDSLLAGQIGGLVIDKSELGPRALGHRSIICRHDNKEMKNIVNKRIKHRESYRPFAGMFTQEQAERIFRLKMCNGDVSPSHLTMTQLAEVSDQFSELNSSVIHVDNTCRIQIVPKCEKFLHQLLVRLEELGVVGLLNTSFNINGQPNVETVEDAIETYDLADLDFLCFVGSKEQTIPDYFLS